MSTSDARPDHWLNPPDLRAATAAQREIAAACEMRDRPAAGTLVGGADTSARWRDQRGPIHAAIAVPGGPVSTATMIPPFPYVPGYLGFRESPALVLAWRSLSEPPGLLLVDGQGRAHPRRCGIAVQLGVLLDVPAIGVAKSLLCGAVEGEVGPHPGDRAPVLDRGEVVAIALRLRMRAAPVFVSIGHRVSLDGAVARVRALADGRRLPPQIRAAHDAANAARRTWQARADAGSGRS